MTIAKLVSHNSENSFYVLARDAFREWIVALLPWCSSICLSICPSVRDGRALWSYGVL